MQATFQECRGIRPPKNVPEFQYPCCGWCTLPTTFYAKIESLTPSNGNCNAAPALNSEFTCTLKSFPTIYCLFNWTNDSNGIGINFIQTYGRWPICPNKYASGSTLFDRFRPSVAYDSNSFYGSCYYDTVTQRTKIDYHVVLLNYPGCLVGLWIYDWS